MLQHEAADFLPLIKAWSEGKTIQVHTGSATDPRWVDMLESTGWSFGGGISNYRIKPEPRLRPWKAEEVPVGSLIRLKPGNSNTLPSLIVSANSYDLSFSAACDIVRLTFGAAFEGYQHSTDGGKTWEICGVEVTD